MTDCDYNCPMDSFFNDPGVQRVPAGETRFLALRAEPDPQRKRLKVGLELTPFEQSPTLEICLYDSDGVCSCAASIIEPPSWNFELTLHIRKKEPAGSYRLTASLFYPDLGEVDREEIPITVPATPQ